MEEVKLTEQLFTDFKETDNKETSAFWEAMKSDASFRPTIFIGLGGFGCGTVRELKKAVTTLIPDPLIRKGFGFIGIDTHTADRGDILTGNEYIGITAITPHVVASKRENRKYLDWYNKLPKGTWKARSISGGANQVRAVGRLAFLYPPTLDKFLGTLRNTYKTVNSFTKSFTVTSAPKVYIVTSLAGGTGAGMFLDLSIIVRKFLSDETSGADVQSIIATADVLEGNVPAINLPDLYTNTYGTLKDIYALAAENSTRVAYAIPGFEAFTADMTSMPNPIFLITGQNQDGRIVCNTFPELKHLVVSYLLFEIHTPLKGGGAEGVKVQDKENDNFDQDGSGGMKKVFSSFGAVRFGVPSEEVKEYFSQIAILKALNKEIQSDFLTDEVNAFLNDQKLNEYGSDQLQEHIRKDIDGINSSTLDLLPKLRGVKTVDLYRQCKALITSNNKLFKNNFHGKIIQNATTLTQNATESIENKINQIYKVRTLSSAVSFIQEFREILKLHQQSLTEELNDGQTKLQNAREKTKLSLEGVNNAAQGGYFGRKRRMELSITTFEADLQVELNQQIVVWSMQEGLNVYGSLVSALVNIGSTWGEATKRLLAKKHFVTKSIHNSMRKLERMADINFRDKGNRFSILNVSHINELYDEYVGAEKEEDLADRIRSHWKKANTLMDVDTSDEIWYNGETAELLPIQNDNLKDLSITNVLSKFYSENDQKHNLLDNLMALGSPLFPLDNHHIEPSYAESWVLAVHPEIEEDLVKFLSSNIPAAAGKSIALYPNKDEAIIYSIKHGLTPHSLARLNKYYSHFSRNMKIFRDATKSARPYYARIESELWGELIPVSKEEEDIRKWFAIGRALSYLFPSKFKEDGEPDHDKNESFIYSRGNYYYLNMTIEHRKKKILLGNGLLPAISEFGDNPEYKDYVQESAQGYISEKGIALVRKRMLEEYLPVLDGEMEKAKSSADHERYEQIEHLNVAIRQYINKELVVSSV